MVGRGFYNSERPYSASNSVALWSFLYITIYHKIIACITAVIFLISIFGNDIAMAARTGLPAQKIDLKGISQEVNLKELNIKEFEVPGKLGMVKDRHEGGAGTIIFIQDAHCNYGAQQAINNIIKHLNEDYGVRLINLEGGLGEYDLSLFTDIKDENTRKKVTDYFMKEGRVTGPEYYAISNPEKVTLYGIEDRDLYVNNLDVYRGSLEYVAGVNNTLNYISRRITELKSYIYTETLLELDGKYNEFKENKFDLKEFIKYIYELSRKKRISVKKFPNIKLLYEAISKERKIDFKKANSERDKLIEELKDTLPLNEMDVLTLKTFLFKTGQLSEASFYSFISNVAKKYRVSLRSKRNLSKYIEYRSIYEEADRIEAFNEIDNLFGAIAAKEYRNDTERELFKISKNTRILKNIFNIKATRNEIDYFNKHKNEFSISGIIEFVERQSMKYGESPHFDNSARLIDKQRDEIMEFYKYALARDEAFMKNIQRSHERFNEDTSIVVAGGFHTENLTSILKDNGYSYVVIRPQFSNKDDYKSPYYKLLSGGLSDIEETVIGAISAIALASLFTGLAVAFYGEEEYGPILDTIEIAKEICKRVLVGDGKCVIAFKKNGTVRFSLNSDGVIVATAISAKDAEREGVDATIDEGDLASLAEKISTEEIAAVPVAAKEADKPKIALWFDNAVSRFRSRFTAAPAEVAESEAEVIRTSTLEGDRGKVELNIFNLTDEPLKIDSESIQLMASLTRRGTPREGSTPQEFGTVLFGRDGQLTRTSGILSGYEEGVALLGEEAANIVRDNIQDGESFVLFHNHPHDPDHLEDDSQIKEAVDASLQDRHAYHAAFGKDNLNEREPRNEQEEMILEDHKRVRGYWEGIGVEPAFMIIGSETHQKGVVLHAFRVKHHSGMFYTVESVPIEESRTATSEAGEDHSAVRAWQSGLFGIGGVGGLITFLSIFGIALPSLVAGIWLVPFILLMGVQAYKAYAVAGAAGRAARPGEDRTDIRRDFGIASGYVSAHESVHENLGRVGNMFIIGEVLAYLFELGISPLFILSIAGYAALAMGRRGLAEIAEAVVEEGRTSVAKKIDNTGTWARKNALASTLLFTAMPFLLGAQGGHLLVIYVFLAITGTAILAMATIGSIRARRYNQVQVEEKTLDSADKLFSRLPKKHEIIAGMQTMSMLTVFALPVVYMANLLVSAGYKLGTSTSAAEQQVVSDNFGVATILLTTYLKIIAGPIIEEYGIRGLLYKTIKSNLQPLFRSKKASGIVAFYGAATIFAFLHGSFYYPPLVFAVHLIAGIGFQSIANRYESLWPAVIAHSLWNAAVVALVYFHIFFSISFLLGIGVATLIFTSRYGVFPTTTARRASETDRRTSTLEGDKEAFDKAWQSGTPLTISPEHLKVLQGPAMGEAFRTPEVMLISEDTMQDVAPGLNVVRLDGSNRILIIASHWNSLGEQQRLDILMHEAMADWMQRERPDVMAEDGAIDLEGEKVDEEARREAHKGLQVDRAMDGEIRRKLTPEVSLNDLKGKYPNHSLLLDELAKSGSIGIDILREEFKKDQWGFAGAINSIAKNKVLFNELKKEDSIGIEALREAFGKDPRIFAKAIDSIAKNQVLFNQLKDTHLDIEIIRVLFRYSPSLFADMDKLVYASKELNKHKDTLMTTVRSEEILKTLDLTGLAIGTQSYVKLLIIERLRNREPIERPCVVDSITYKSYLDYLTKTVIPGLKAAEEITKDYPTLGMELHINYKKDSPESLAFAIGEIVFTNCLASVQVSHGLGVSGMEKGLKYQLRIPPTVYPIFLMLVEKLHSQKIIKPTHAYMATVGGDYLKEAPFLLSSLFFSYIPSEIQERFGYNLPVPDYDEAAYSSLLYPAVGGRFVGATIDAWTGKLLDSSDPQTKGTQTNLFYAGIISLVLKTIDPSGRRLTQVETHNLFEKDLTRLFFLITGAAAHLDAYGIEDPALKDIYASFRSKIMAFYMRSSEEGGFGISTEDISRLFPEIGPGHQYTKIGSSLKELHKTLKDLTAYFKGNKGAIAEFQDIINQATEDIRNHLFPEGSLRASIISQALRRDWRGAIDKDRFMQAAFTDESDLALTLLDTLGYTQDAARIKAARRKSTKEEADDQAIDGVDITEAAARRIWQEAERKRKDLPEGRIDHLKEMLAKFSGALPAIRILSQERMNELGANGARVIRYENNIVIAQEFYDSDLSEIVTDEDALAAAQRGEAKMDGLLNVLVHEMGVAFAEGKNYAALGMHLEGKRDIKDWEDRLAAHEGLEDDWAMDGAADLTIHKEMQSLIDSLDEVDKNILTAQEYKERVRTLLKDVNAELAAANGLPRYSDERRPRNSSREPGAVVKIEGGESLIHIGDLHGRFDNLVRILEDSKLAQRIESGERLHIVFTGDIVHPQLSYGMYDDNQYVAVATLKALLLFLKLKTTFPDNVHFIPGNHENAYPGGNIPYRSNEDQTMLFAETLENLTGFVEPETFINELTNFAGHSPLMMMVKAKNGYVLLTHASGKEDGYADMGSMVHSEQDLIDVDQIDRMNGNPYMTALFWGRGYAAESIEKVLNAIGGVLWISGHTPMRKFTEEQKTFSAADLEHANERFARVGRMIIADAHRSRFGYLDINLGKDVPQDLEELKDSSDNPAYHVPLGRSVTEAAARRIWSEAERKGRDLPEGRIDHLKEMLAKFFGALPAIRILSQERMNELGANGARVIRYENNIVIAQEFYDSDLSEIVTDQDALAAAQRGEAKMDGLLNVLVHEMGVAFAEGKNYAALGMHLEGKTDIKDWEDRLAAHEGLEDDWAMDGAGQKMGAVVGRVTVLDRDQNKMVGLNVFHAAEMSEEDMRRASESLDKWLRYEDVRVEHVSDMTRFRSYLEHGERSQLENLYLVMSEDGRDVEDVLRVGYVLREGYTGRSGQEIAPWNRREAGDAIRYIGIEAEARALALKMLIERHGDDLYTRSNIHNIIMLGHRDPGRGDIFDALTVNEESVEEYLQQQTRTRESMIDKYGLTDEGLTVQQAWEEVDADASTRVKEIKDLIGELEKFLGQKGLDVNIAKEINHLLVALNLENQKRAIQIALLLAKEGIEVKVFFVTLVDILEDRWDNSRDNELLDAIENALERIIDAAIDSGIEFGLTIPIMMRIFYMYQSPARLRKALEFYVSNIRSITTRSALSDLSVATEEQELFMSTIIGPGWNAVAVSAAKKPLLEEPKADDAQEDIGATQAEIDAPLTGRSPSIAASEHVEFEAEKVSLAGAEPAVSLEGEGEGIVSLISKGEAFFDQAINILQSAWAERGMDAASALLWNNLTDSLTLIIASPGQIPANDFIRHLATNNTFLFVIVREAIEERMPDVIPDDGQRIVGEALASAQEGMERDVMARINALRERDLKYGLRSGSLSDEKKKLRERFLYMFITEGIERPVAERLAHTFMRMNRGAVEILFITGVLTEEERALLMIQDWGALLTLYRPAKDGRNPDRDRFIAVILEIVHSYNEFFMVNRDFPVGMEVMMKRLVPLWLISILSSEFNISPSFIESGIMGHPDFPEWLPRARDMIDRIQRNVRGRGNAAHIVFALKLGELERRVELATPIVRDLMSARGIGEDEAWDIVITSGLPKYTPRKETVVDDKRDDEQPEADYGLEGPAITRQARNALLAEIFGSNNYRIVDNDYELAKTEEDAKLAMALNLAQTIAGESDDLTVDENLVVVAVDDGSNAVLRGRTSNRGKLKINGEAKDVIRIGQSMVTSDQFIWAHSVIEIALAIVHENEASRERQRQQAAYVEDMERRGIAFSNDDIERAGDANIQHASGVEAERLFLAAIPSNAAEYLGMDEAERQRLMREKERERDRYEERAKKAAEEAFELAQLPKPTDASSISTELAALAIATSSFNAAAVELDLGSAPVLPAETAVEVDLVRTSTLEAKPVAEAVPTRRVILKSKEDVENYIGDVYYSIKHAPAVDLTTGDIKDGRGAYGATTNGTRKMSKYVAVIRSSRIAPYRRGPMVFEDQSDPNLLNIGSTNRFFNQIGYEDLIIIQADSASDLADQLARYGDAVNPGNTFIYADNKTPGATIDNIQNQRDAEGNKVFEGYMMANLVVPAEEDGVSFVLVGGLVMLAISAMDLAHRADVGEEDLGHIYDLLASLQKKDRDEVMEDFQQWVSNPIEAFTSGSLNIRLPALSKDISSDLRKHYRGEQDIQAAM